MRRDDPNAALVALICMLAFGATFVVYTARYLPDSVATHFDVTGQADGWMSRVVYIWFALAFLSGLPILIAYLITRLSRRLPQWTNIPNRAYWLAPERRAASMGFLAAQGFRLGCFIVMVTIGLHYTILVANQQSPPVLPMRTFSAVIGAFFIVLTLWVVKFYQRFPKEHRPNG
jgi:serine/threonine-protein kinase